MKRKSRRLYGVSGGRVGGRPGLPQGRVVIKTPKLPDLRRGNKPNFDDWIKNVNDGIDKYHQGKAVLDRANAAVDEVKLHIKKGLKTNEKQGFKIGPSPTSATDGGSPLAAHVVSNSSRKMTLANVSDDRLVHKTVYETGTKSSKSVMAAKKTNGSGYLVIADSKKEVKDLEGRNILTQGSGFNQTQFHIPPTKSQVPIEYIKSLCNGNGYLDQEESFEERRVISNVVNIKQQYMIKNQSSSGPMTFTIHLVKIKHYKLIGSTMNSLFLNMFYSSTEWDELGGELLDTPGGNNFTLLKKGFVPKYLQHAGLIRAGDEDMLASSVQVSNKLNLSSSSNFRTGVEVVESFSKTIAPGDYWNFSHIHHCGSGIDLNELFRVSNGGDTGLAVGIPSDDTDSKLPFTYGVIFECRGKMSEAYHIPATDSINTYLGTGPTSYMYEFKTSAYFAARDGSTDVEGPSTRIYEQDETITKFGARNESREFFVEPFNIASTVLDPALEASVGKAYFATSSSTNTNATQYEGVRNPG